MEFIDIPAEQSTAATDVILAVITLSAALYFYRISQTRRNNIIFWVWFFGLLALEYLLGAFVHGIKLSVTIQEFVWQCIYLLLGFSIGIFLVAIIYDILGKSVAMVLLPFMIIFSLLFFTLTFLSPDGFLIFILYATMIKLFAVGCYIWAAFQKQFKGAWFMANGILITFIASGVQISKTISLDVIWYFDHNGVSHLIQIVAIAFMITGLRKTHLAH